MNPDKKLIQMNENEVCIKFCEICNWTYESWQIHKFVFDKNENKEETIGKAKHFTSKLSYITLKYVLLQISKLHDPSAQSNNSNISISYMLEKYDWGDKRVLAQEISQRLNQFYTYLKPARNKLLSHNDLKSNFSWERIGHFPEGRDEDYFKDLQEFVNLISEVVNGSLYPFNDLVAVDIQEFLEVLKNSKI